MVRVVEPDPVPIPIPIPVLNPYPDPNPVPDPVPDPDPDPIPIPVLNPDPDPNPVPDPGLGLRVNFSLRANPLISPLIPSTRSDQNPQTRAHTSARARTHARTRSPACKISKKKRQPKTHEKKETAHVGSATGKTANIRCRAKAVHS